MQQVLSLVLSKNASWLDFMLLKCDYYSEFVVYKSSCIICRLVTIDDDVCLERVLFGKTDYSSMLWIGCLKSNKYQKIKVFHWLCIDEWDSGQQADLQNSREESQ